RDTGVTRQLIDACIDHFKLDERGQSYLQGIAALLSLPNEAQRNIILETLYSLKPEAHYEIDALHLVQFLHSWLHSVVLESLSLKPRHPVAQQIASRLGHP